MYKKTILNTQKKKFLSTEGDEMYKRNEKFYENNDTDNDFLAQKILQIFKKKKLKNKSKILEIGCGDAYRLKYLSKKLKLNKIYGIDPSKKAIKKANSSKVIAKVGTADCLPFKNKQFDIVVFGFCLYLIDDEDLFRVIQEADRVLKNNGYIVIYDFYSIKVKYKSYKHCKDLKSRHMNYKNFFTIHPLYKLISENIFLYEKSNSTKIPHTYVSISVVLKK